MGEEEKKLEKKEISDGELLQALLDRKAFKAARAYIEYLEEKEKPKEEEKKEEGGEKTA